MRIVRKVIYSRIGTNMLKFICSLFYDKKYLRGKFFEEKRMGYIWAIKSIPRSFKLRKHGVRWPVSKYTSYQNGSNIHLHPSSLNVFQQFGCYFQGFESITIGEDVWIAQNVGIITANHDLYDPEKHSIGRPVTIGDKCWIGMNSVILPGVTLGNNTIVGAGSVVTKSFPEGHCVIVGNPAHKIKDL